MADWLVEEGIGEHRAVRLEHGAIADARIGWPGGLTAGEVAEAALISRIAGASRGTVRFANGEEALVDGLPRDAAEGAPLRVEVVRAAIAEKGRFKRAQARPTRRPVAPAPSLAQRLKAEGHTVRIVRRFPEGDWDELVAEAWDAQVGFAGGSLTLAPTPAMTLIDIDGTLPPPALALAAVAPLAGALRRFDVAGSIGIDFPTLTEKPARRAVDEALANALDGWPHERTAMNGFGFVQIVSRLERPSLLQRIAHDPAGAAVRRLLRDAERLDDAGALLITAHPVVLAAATPEWRDALGRRSGRIVRWQADPALALRGGHAQIVSL